MLAVDALYRRRLVLDLFALVSCDEVGLDDMAELTRVKFVARPLRRVLVFKVQSFLKHLLDARDAYRASVDVDAGEVAKLITADVAGQRGMVAMVGDRRGAERGVRPANVRLCRSDGRKALNVSVRG